MCVAQHCAIHFDLRPHWLSIGRCRCRRFKSCRRSPLYGL